MGPKPMLVFFMGQLTKRQPFQVQSQIDTALLLILDRFPRGAHVSVDIQNCRKLAGEILRFIENGCGLKSGDNFVAELACSVLPSRINEPEVFKLWGGGHPLLGPAVINNVS